MTAERLESVAVTLWATHDAASYNEYGRCDRPGYMVTEGAGSTARVSYVAPPLDLTEENRLSPEELAAARAGAIESYATTLENAGFTVRRRTTRNTGERILLVSRPA